MKSHLGLTEAIAYTEAQGERTPVGIMVAVKDLKAVMLVIEDCDLRLRRGRSAARPKSALAIEIGYLAKEMRRARREEKK